MELWNDFEGKTVAGRFPLERLLGPQGRSAFFSTTANGSGPAVIRLIESHFDEEEILGRWRVVTTLAQANLQAMKECGETELEGTKLVYAVLEPTDMELADALRERPLTVAETRQVATAVLAALRTLHEAGLVHEHVEAAYVLAQGDVVKLRSDCVREAAEGAAGEASRATDVRGVALLIAEALTQVRDEGRAAELPAPFAEMVRRGASGGWGIAEMEAALADSVLGPVLGRPATAGTGRVLSMPASGVAGRSVEGATRGLAPARAVEVLPIPSGAAGVGAVKTAAPVASEHSPEAVAARTASVEDSRSGAASGRLRAEAGRVAEAGRGGFSRTGDAERIVLEPVETDGRRTGVLAGAAVAGAVVLGLVGWHVTHREAPAPVAVTAPATVAGGAAPTTGAAKPSAGMTTGGRRSVASAAPAAAGTAGGHGGWRVVAFTYNREDQARHKAEQIAGRHAGLRPEVWTPNGRAPYLVSLGGWMDEREAEGLAGRAKRDGLPRDTFARNYRR